MILTKEDLIAAVHQGFQPEYLFFWGHQPSKDGQIGKQCLSQWFAAPFRLEGVTYPTAEHYMMSEKARLFGDEEMYKQILLAPDPETAKKLGRLVKGYENGVWLQHRFDIVVRANEAKFGQNDALRSFLASTRDKILVEASPYDTIWGVGLKEADPQINDPEKWRGLNLLGFALMVVRSRLSV